VNSGFKTTGKEAVVAQLEVSLYPGIFLEGSLSHDNRSLVRGLVSGCGGLEGEVANYIGNAHVTELKSRGCRYVANYTIANKTSVCSSVCQRSRCYVGLMLAVDGAS
jgi:hypothetical protein